MVVEKTPASKQNSTECTFILNLKRGGNICEYGQQFFICIDLPDYQIKTLEYVSFVPFLSNVE